LVARLILALGTKIYYLMQGAMNSVVLRTEYSIPLLEVVIDTSFMHIPFAFGESLEVSAY